MWHETDRPEEGIALIYVIFVTMVLAALATVFIARAVVEARATGAAANREAAVHVAEAGAEAILGLINDEGKTFAEKVITEGPTSSSTTVADHEYDPPTGASDEELRAWEAQWATELAEADWELSLSGVGYTTRVITTDEGQAFGIRPKHPDVDQAYDVVFGVGFVPSIDADHRRTRVIKMQIARRFYSPDQALLTGGPLTLGGNAAITAPGCDFERDDADPDPAELDCVADVHSNGSITFTGSSAVVQGSVTAQGAVSPDPPPTGIAAGGIAGGQSGVEVPTVSARELYGRKNIAYNIDPGGQTVAWWDLCPDGTVRYPAATPCDGTVAATPSAQDPFRGWSYSSATRRWNGSAILAGIFYVYQANARVTGTSTDVVSSECANDPALLAACEQRAISIFAEADPANESKTGSLEVTGNPSMISAFPDLLFVTDNDLKIQGTAAGGTVNCTPTETTTCQDLQAYTGLILVGEQADLSGTVNLAGALITANQEADSSFVDKTVVRGTLILDFDEDLTVDLTGRVTIEFWNEL